MQCRPIAIKKYVVITGGKINDILFYSILFYVTNSIPFLPLRRPRLLLLLSITCFAELKVENVPKMKKSKLPRHFAFPVKLSRSSWTIFHSFIAEKGFLTNK
jgi:hypothetical protein